MSARSLGEHTRSIGDNEGQGHRVAPSIVAASERSTLGSTRGLASSPRQPFRARPLVYGESFHGMACNALRAGVGRDQRGTEST